MFNSQTVGIQAKSVASEGDDDNLDAQDNEDDDAEDAVVDNPLEDVELSIITGVPLRGSFWS